jgi:hypothetical protein
MSAQRRKQKTAPRKAAPVRKQPRKRRVLGAEAGRLLRHSRWIYALGFMLLHVILAYLVIEPAPHTGGDNAGYVTLAQSLLERGTYQDLYDPAEPPHTQYPPVFPIILAAASLVGLTSWMQIKYLIIAFSAIGVGFTYLWIRRRRRPELAFGVALVMALAPGVLGLSHWELSDVPFWALTMIALWAWDRLRPGDYKTLALAVIATTLAYFTRSAGLPLLIAAGAWLIWKHRWQQLGIFAVVILPLAVLWWWRARTQGGVDYVGQFWFVNPYDPSLGRIGFGELLARMKDNGGKYLSWHLPVLLFGVQRYLPLSVLIVALGVYGWVMRLRRPRISEVFLPLYIGLLLVWPAVWSGERFLLPALPFILYYAGDGLVRIIRMTMPAAARLAPAMLAGFMVLLGIPQLSQARQLSRECMAVYRTGDEYACLPPDWKDFYGVAEIAPRVLPDSAVVLSRKPRNFYSASGLQGQNYPLFPEPDSFFKAARATGARYVLFDRLDGVSQAYLAPVLITRSNNFCILFGLGQDRATVFGIMLEGLAVQPQQQNVQFATCGDEFWRSTAARDSLMRGLIRF